MINSNEPIAQYYDIIYENLRPRNLTESEISLMNFLAAPTSKVLDIGGGTGRHALILDSQKFNVTVIDSSEGMLKEIENKKTQIQIINKDIYKVDLIIKYDLIILMWNSFNEIALTKKDAISLLRKLKRNLKKSGSILINIDNADIINPAKFDFKLSKDVQSTRLESNWTTYKFNSRTNTSISKEEINIFKGEKLIDTRVGYIKQRYWRLSEIKKMSGLVHLRVEIRHINNSGELYIILVAK